MSKSLARSNKRKGIRQLAASMSGMGAIVTQTIMPSKSNYRRTVKQARLNRQLQYDAYGKTGRGFTQTHVTVD